MQSSRARIVALGGLALLALAGLGAYVLLRPRPTAELARAEPQPSGAEAAPERLTPRAVDPEPRAPLAENPGADPGPLASIHGRVLDASGAGLADLLVSATAEIPEDAPVARSGADGSFALVPESLPCLVSVAEAGWTTLCAGEVLEDAPAGEALVVAAKILPLKGSVAGRGAGPLAGARIAARMDPETLAAVLGGRNAALQGKWNGASAADGSFVLDALPALPRIHLITSHPGWRTDERDVDLAAGAEPSVVLEREEPTGPRLDGVVVHADGSAVRDALVSLGSARVRTDAQGAFHLMCSWFDRGTPLVACARGFQPAVLPAFGAGIDAHADVLAPERIVLAGPGLEIEGRIVGPDGTPYKGWYVSIEDGTPLDPGGSSREIAEFETSGRTEVKSGTAGVFKFTGLGARSYTLLASARDRRSRAELALRSEPIAAGTRGIVLRAPDANPGPPIRGRILDLAGAPVSGVLLGLGRPVPEGSPAEYGWQGRFRTSSGPDGRFEIANAPGSLVFVVASSPAITPVRIALEPGAARSALELRLPSRREFSFDASRASPRPDHLRALTAAGMPTRIWTIESAAPQSTWLAALTGGRSALLAVGEDAHEIVIYRGAIELGRVAAPSASSGSTQLSWP